MTAIAAYVDAKHTIWMGGDSAGVAGYGLSTLSRRKIFIKDDFIFGYTHSFRMADILQYCFSIPPRMIGQSNEEYICATIIPALRGAFSEHGFVSQEEGQEAGGSFLMGHKGRVYSIQSDFALLYRDAPYDAVGCGEDFCIGAMHALTATPKKTGSEVVLAALKAAEANSAGVRGPFFVEKLPHSK